MKKILALVLLLVVGVSTVFAQHNANEKPASPHETVKAKNVSITYGRPYKKGRDIFGGLVPYGQVWRTGADEATQITLDRPCMFAGRQLAPGTYTLFTIPEKDKWTIIVNASTGQWGAFGYDKIKTKDVIHVEVPVKPLDKSVEQFTITAGNEGFNMAWDKTSVMVPLQFF